MNLPRKRRLQIPDEEWEKHESAIRQYVGEKKLEGEGGVIDTMEREHNFSARGPNSKSQYETRLKKWKIRKNITKEDWSSIIDTLDTRGLRGKRSEIYLFGKRVEPRRIEKERKRYQGARRQIQALLQEPCPKLPEHVSIKTPPPTPSTHVIRSPFFHYDSPSLSFMDTTPGQNLGTAHRHHLNEVENLYEELQPVITDNIDMNHTLSMRAIPGSVTEASITPNSMNMNLSSNAPSFDISFATTQFCEQGSLLSFLGSLEKTILPVFQEIFGGSPRPMALGNFSKMMFTPATASQIERHGPDLGSIYTVISTIANGHVRLENLADPSNPLDKAIKKVIMYFNHLGIHRFNEILESFPKVFLPSLEAGIFGAAVELGASEIVEAILRRGLDPTQMSLKYNQGTYKPLERAYINGHMGVTRTILVRNVGPNKTQNIRLFDENRNPKGTHLMDWKISDMEADMLALLLQSGMKIPLDPGQGDPIYYGERRFPPLKDLDAYCKFVGNAFDFSTWTIYEIKFLGEVFSLSNSHLVYEITKAFLDHNWDQKLRDSKAFQDCLTTSLSDAIKHHHGKAFYELLKRGAQPNSKTLCHAIISRDLEAIRHLLEIGVSISGARGFMNMVPIVEVILSDCPEIWSMFRQQADISICMSDFDTVVQCVLATCKVGNEEILEELFLWLDSCRWGHSGTRPIFTISDSYEVAIQSGNEFLVPKLLAKGILPSVESLNAAIWYQKFDIVRGLLDIVTSNMLDHPTSWPLTLCLAAHRGCLVVIRALLVIGMEIDCNWRGIYKGTKRPYRDNLLDSREKRIKDGFMQDESFLRPALTTAILSGKKEVVEDLLELNAPLECKLYSKFLYDYSFGNVYGAIKVISPLAAAVHVGDFEMVKRLITMGADPCDNLALQQASTLGRYEIISLLLKVCRERIPSFRKGFGAAALISAIESEDVKMVYTLASSTDAEHIPDPGWEMTKKNREIKKNREVKDRGELTAFGTAISSTGPQSSQMIEILLLHGTNPNGLAGHVHDHLGSDSKIRVTPILLAIYSRRIDRVKLLESMGADIHAPAVSGIKRTPFQAAVEVGALDIIEYLLAKGVNVNEPPAACEGYTALQIAAGRGFMGIAALLIDRGANVNAPSCQFGGRTAFEAAAEDGRIEMLMYLIEQGADIISDNGKQYRDAIQFAKADGQPGIVEYVEKIYTEQCLNMALITSFPDFISPLGWKGIDEDMAS